jgi:hypothetical protein
MSLEYRKLALARCPAIGQLRGLVRSAFVSPLSFGMSHCNKDCSYNAIVACRAEGTAYERPRACG